MKSRPTIFLSGVSHEFGSFRDAVETELQMKGCFAENQPSIPPDYRSVDEMLRRKLHDADAVIHIVGFRFGAEPHERPAGTQRRSYTQMEFDIARAMQKPVFVFISKGASVSDAAKPEEAPEDAEATASQLAHREAVHKTNFLYYSFNDKAELCRLAAEISIVAQAGEFKVDISRIIKFAPATLIGREAETQSFVALARKNSSCAAFLASRGAARLRLQSTSSMAASKRLWNASTARRATSTKLGTSRLAGRCHCTWRTFICTEPGCLGARDRIRGSRRTTI